MELFEYLTVAISIVLASGVVRLVEGLGAAGVAAKRYWVHLGYVIALVVTHLFYWWVLWSYREGVDWNFARFAYAFLGPLLLYFQATSLIPRDLGTASSWREHFFRIRSRFFLVLATFFVYQGLARVVLRGTPPVAGTVPSLLLGVSLALVGAYSSSSRVQAGVLVALWANFLLGSITVFFQPR